MANGKLDLESTQHGIQVLRRSAINQAQLIHDLLDISRIQEGKISLEIQKIEPAHVIHAAVESIQIQIAIDPFIKYIFADPIRLQQILWNLINNAIKFSPQGGQIWITVDMAGALPEERILIQVRDNGRGIQQDFLPFIQMDNAASPETPHC